MGTLNTKSKLTDLEKTIVRKLIVPVSLEGMASLADFNAHKDDASIHFKLAAGSNITIADDGQGTYTISSTGGVTIDLEQVPTKGHTTKAVSSDGVYNASYATKRQPGTYTTIAETRGIGYAHGWNAETVALIGKYHIGDLRGKLTQVCMQMRTDAGAYNNISVQVSYSEDFSSGEVYTSSNAQRVDHDGSIRVWKFSDGPELTGQPLYLRCRNMSEPDTDKPFICMFFASLYPGDDSKVKQSGAWQARVPWVKLSAETSVTQEEEVFAGEALRAHTDREIMHLQYSPDNATLIPTFDGNPPVWVQRSEQGRDGVYNIVTTRDFTFTDTDIAERDRRLQSVAAAVGLADMRDYGPGDGDAYLQAVILDASLVPAGRLGFFSMRARAAATPGGYLIVYQRPAGVTGTDLSKWTRLGASTNSVSGGNLALCTWKFDGIILDSSRPVAFVVSATRQGDYTGGPQFGARVLAAKAGTESIIKNGTRSYAFTPEFALWTCANVSQAPVPEVLDTTATLLHNHVYTMVVTAATDLSSLSVEPYGTCELLLDYVAGSVDWGAIWWAEGSAPTLAAGKSYCIALRNDGMKLRANLQYEDTTPAQS